MRGIHTSTSERQSEPLHLPAGKAPAQGLHHEAAPEDGWPQFALGVIRITFADGARFYLDNGYITRVSPGAASVFGDPNIPLNYSVFGTLSVDDIGANDSTPPNSP
jgi:hypothetical protein